MAWFSHILTKHINLGVHCGVGVPSLLESNPTSWSCFSCFLISWAFLMVVLVPYFWTSWYELDSTVLKHPQSIDKYNLLLIETGISLDLLRSFEILHLSNYSFEVRSGLYLLFARVRGLKNSSADLPISWFTMVYSMDSSTESAWKVCL